MVHCKHGNGRRTARRGLEASLPRMPWCKEEVLAISRTVISQEPGADLRSEFGIASAGGSRLGTAWAVARKLGMVALAAFGILVVLPSALAAQALAY